MSKQQKGLGHGLGALIPDLDESTGTPNKLPIQKIEPNPAQPRKQFSEEELSELADSIREHGIIEPLAVRESKNGYYEIISGERRWRAARMAGLSEVPVYIHENVDDRTMMEMALIENLQREDLNPIEEAGGYKTLMDEYSLTQEEVAKEVGKSRPAVTNALRLLALPEELRNMLVEGTISAGHCRAILSLQEKSKQLQAAKKVVSLHLSVRQTETLCRNMERDEAKQEEKSVPFRVNYIADCEKSMSSLLGRKVKITDGKRKGKFEIEYYGQDDLQALLDQLQKLKK